MSLNYKNMALFKGGRPVDSFRIVGFLAEIALKMSLKVGLTALSTSDLPPHVNLRLDRRGDCDVQAFDDDRDLAVTIATAVRLKLHRSGFAVKDAVNRDNGAEHDLILDVVDIEPAGAVYKFVSGELRCRRIYSEAGRKKIRGALQKECVDECAWWQQLAQTNKWSGRLVILAEFGRSGSDFVLRADYTPVQGHARGLWGWPGSRLTLASGTSPALRQTQPQTIQTTAAPKAKARATAAKIGSKPSWGDMRSKLVFRTEDNERVSSVPTMLKECKKAFGRGDPAHAGEKMAGWKRRCPSGVAFKAQRKSRKGGSAEWVATEPLLHSIYESV